jgi:hypothetical protein
MLLFLPHYRFNSRNFLLHTGFLLISRALMDPDLVPNVGNDLTKNEELQNWTYISLEGFFVQR